LLLGDNGHGKTTILEAISLICHTKSFHAAIDKQMVGNDSESGYTVFGRALLDNGFAHEIKIHYPKIGNKRITDITEKRISPKDILGILPLVTLSPDDRELTMGGPEPRRSYMDRILSQVSNQYLKDILGYRKILKQRNKVLSNFKKHGFLDESSLSVWTDKLIQSGVEITIQRAELISNMIPKFESYYNQFAGSTEKAKIEYVPHYLERMGASEYTTSDVTTKFKDNLLRLSEVEKHRGTSLVGPQRDDLQITINTMHAKESASQGQHKSLLIALKLTEFDYIMSSTNTQPLVILDDIFSELDKKRSHRVLQMLNNFGGQVFISSTDATAFDSETLVKARIFDIENGQATKRL
jgi:DNA replication and repair protein RecF